MHEDEIIVFSIEKNGPFSSKNVYLWTCVKFCCKIANSQLTVFKKKKRKKKLIYESIHTDSKTKFTKITEVDSKSPAKYCGKGSLGTFG